jgi:cardiolipin synthase
MGLFPHARMLRRFFLLLPLTLPLWSASGNPAHTAGGDQTFHVSPLRMVRGSLARPDLAALNGLSTVGVGEGGLGPGEPPCPAPAAPLDRVLYDHLRGQGAALSCGNAFGGLLHFPNDDSGRSDQRPDPMGGFATVAREIRAARREVLLANMLWDDGPQAPGALLARAVADLRREVAAHPERFAQGLTVRLMFGNSLRLDSLLDPTSSVYSAARHLLQAGIPLSDDPVPGFHLELANYTYARPHSHLKLLVIDGEQVTAGGFNISWFHVPASTPGGLDLTDLALTLRGPVARQAVAAFRDSWGLSRQLSCRPGAAAATLRRDCDLDRATHGMPLGPERAPSVPGASRAYGLYTRNGYTDQDTALPALFAAAHSSIDLMQAQVSGTLSCSLSLLVPGGCPYPQQALPVWRAIVGAIERRGVTVRLILDYDPLLRAEPLALLAGIRAHLQPLGLQDHLQVRWSGTAGGMHTKAALVDGAMLTVGSHNLHFSSFGNSGLNEFTLATSDPGALRAARQTFEFEWARGLPLELPVWLRP